MIILYIPFTAEEGVTDLFARALRWQQYYNENAQGNADKVPMILHYQTIAQDTERNAKIREAIKNGDAKIYILAHGLDGDELAVSNIADIKDIEDEKLISMDELAAIFLEDFYNNGNFSDANTVKLYFCDAYLPIDKNEKMAKRLNELLAATIPELNVQYYSGASVSEPLSQSVKFTHALFNQEDKEEPSTDPNRSCLIALMI